MYLIIDFQCKYTVMHMQHYIISGSNMTEGDQDTSEQYWVYECSGTEKLIARSEHMNEMGLSMGNMGLFLCFS